MLGKSLMHSADMILNHDLASKDSSSTGDIKMDLHSIMLLVDYGLRLIFYLPGAFVDIGYLVDVDGLERLREDYRSLCPSDLAVHAFSFKESVSGSPNLLPPRLGLIFSS